MEVKIDGKISDNDITIIVLGPQGCGKTTMVDKIVPVIKGMDGKKVVNIVETNIPASESLFS